MESLGERRRIDVTQPGEKRVRAALKRVWLDSRPEALQRLETLERFSESLRSGISDQTAREGALAAAHRLSGALGMFGYDEASACAGEIESMLAGGPSPDGSRVAELVTRLRGLLEKTEAQYTTRLEKDDS